MNKSILIVGLGSVGKFHLISILKSKKKLDITLVDSSNKALDDSYIIFKENKNHHRHNLNLIDNINAINDKYDIALLAVSSDVRFKIFKKINNLSKIKFFILEKFLFQKISEYNLTKKIINEKKIKVWVNCWRRTFKIYKEIKKNKKKNEQFDIHLKGKEWGLACNSIHFIDLFCWLNNYRHVDLQNELLHNKIFNSKRNGYIEFYGTVLGKKNNNVLSMSCSKDKKKSLFITLESKDKLININELEGIMTIKSKNRDRFMNFESPKVSNLTLPVVNDILNKRKCYLPTFSESEELHILLLECFINKAQLIKKKKINQLKIT